MRTCVARLYHLSRDRDMAGFRAAFDASVALFARDHLLDLQQALDEVCEHDALRAITLEDLGDNVCRLSRSAVCRELALYAYRAAAAAPSADGRLLLKIGTLYLERLLSDREQNVLAARSTLESALERMPPDDVEGRGRAHNALGVAYGEPPSAAASHRQAFGHFEDALRIFQGRRWDSERAMVLLNQGNAAARTSLNRALACYDESLAIALRLDHAADAAQVEQNIGLVLLQWRGDGETGAERVEQAVAVLRRSLERTDPLRQPYAWAVAKQNLGKSLAHRQRGDRTGNFTEALRHFTDAGAIFLQYGDVPSALGALAGQGGTLYELGDWQGASAAFERALALQHTDWFEQAAAQTRVRVARERVALTNFAVIAAWRERQPEKAVEIMETGRHRVLTAAYFARQLPAIGGVSPREWTTFDALRRRRAALEQEITRLRLEEEGGGMPMRELERDLERCRLEHERAGRRLRTAGGDPVPLFERLELESMRELARRLRAPICALRPTTKGTLLFVMRADGVFAHDLVESATTGHLQDLFTSDGGFVHAYQAVKHARLEGRNPEHDLDRWSRALDDALALLHELLVEPMLSMMGFDGTARGQLRPVLYLLSGGPLELVPLHATFAERGGVRRYLADLVDVAHVPSLRLLAREAGRPRRRPSQLVICQGPDAALRYQRWEAAAAAAVFGEQRSEIVVAPLEIHRRLDTLREGTVLLASCHGISHTNDALRSGLSFGPGAQPDVPLWKILSGNFGHCALVVLNACETSLAEFEDPADECMSLANAFLASGTSVVGTQWEAHDLAASLWSVRFLQLLGSESSLLRAACATSLWLRDSSFAEKRGLIELRADAAGRRYLDDLRQHAFDMPYFWANHRFHGVG